MSSQLKRVGAILRPLDVLFFRDGRPFAAATRAFTGLPFPQTTAGAVWGAILQTIGFDFDKMRDGFHPRSEPHTNGNSEYQIWRDALRQAGAPDWFFQISLRGPWFVVDTNTWPHNKSAASPYKPSAPNWELVFPMPAALYQKKKRSDQDIRLQLGLPLNPQKFLPGWKPPLDNMRPVWIQTEEDLEPASGYLNFAGMEKFLRGELPDNEQIVSAGQLFDFDNRTGIAIKWDTLTCEERHLYTASFLALKKGVAFYIELFLPKEAVSTWKSISVLRWGGEGKRAEVIHLDAPLRWPERPQRNGGRPFFVLTTPSIFAEGWFPRGLKRQLVAAVVPGEIAVSGWDLLRQGPKRTRFGVAAGSVYFLDDVPEEFKPKTDEGQQGEGIEDTCRSLADDEFDQRQGWGCFLQGVWNYV